MNNIWIINGEGGCGKDTFVQYVQDIVGAHRVLNISTVDYVKQVAESLGWKGTKTQDDRKYLSDLKQILTYWGDVPFTRTVNHVEGWLAELKEYGIKDGYVFIHCREPKEIQRLVDRLGANTILIDREQNIFFKNYSDANVHNYKYDYVVDNNGSLDDLHIKAIEFVEKKKAED